MYECGSPRVSMCAFVCLHLYMHMLVNEVRNMYKVFKTTKNFRREPVIKFQCIKLTLKNILNYLGTLCY